MGLNIDFVRDVARRCVERLTEAGYAPQPANDEDAIRTYVAVLHRRVRPRPRRLHKAAYTVPAHLAVGEQRLLAKVTAGDDLWPHQSRKIGKLSVEDGMLNDYGIQHFHLGIAPDARHPNLISGTKELLFAVVKDSDFYTIGIYDHKAWSMVALFDVVHATWPALTDPYTVRGAVGLARNLTDAEAAQYRAAGINVARQRADGGIQIGMGGGINAAGGSVAVVRETDCFIDHIERVQARVTAILGTRVKDRVPSPDASVRLAWDGDVTYAVSDPPGVQIEITGGLMVPPL